MGSFIVNSVLPAMDGKTSLEVLHGLAWERRRIQEMTPKFDIQEQTTILSTLNLNLWDMVCDIWISARLSALDFVRYLVQHCPKDCHVFTHTKTR